MTKPLFELTINRHIKSTVRGNLSHNYWKYANNPHTSINNFTTCSSSGKLITFSILTTLIKIYSENNFIYLIKIIIILFKTIP
jgi:hypothetical protein